MELDRKKLEAILSLDDEAFRNLARAVAEAAGASRAQTEAITRNPDFIKSRIGKMSDDELKSLIDSAGEKRDDIKQMLYDRGVDLGR